MTLALSIYLHTNMPDKVIACPAEMIPRRIQQLARQTGTAPANPLQGAVQRRTPSL